MSQELISYQYIPAYDRCKDGDESLDAIHRAHSKIQEDRVYFSQDANVHRGTNSVNIMACAREVFVRCYEEYFEGHQVLKQVFNLRTQPPEETLLYSSH